MFLFATCSKRDNARKNFLRTNPVSLGWSQLIRTTAFSLRGIPRGYLGVGPLFFASRGLNGSQNVRRKLKKIADDPPKVSVIVPTYNRPQMLGEALQSILNQNYRHFEIVVVNDGGPDVQSALTRLRGNNDIVYLRHDVNKGSAAARNTGLKVARGKYVAYLDDDDVFRPDHLGTLVGFLETTGHKVTYSDAYRAHQRSLNGAYRIVGRDIPYSYDFDYDLILIRNFVPMICLMHEKSCGQAVGFFDEALRVHEDWDFLIRVSRQFQIAHIRKVTCEFRWREDGSTLTSSRRTDFGHTTRIIYDKYRAYSRMPTPAIASPSSLFSKAFRGLSLYNLYAKRWGHVEAARRMLRFLSPTENSSRLS